jgi:Transglutaminase-like superfamily
MWERLQRFRALDSVARGLFLRASVLLPLISAGLFVRGFGRTRAALQRFLPSQSAATAQPSHHDAGSVMRTERMVRAAAHFSPLRFTCLEISLALWWLLGRQGIASTVSIGARKKDGNFEAHAWVDCGGVALGEPAEPQQPYAPFEEPFAVH